MPAVHIFPLSVLKKVGMRDSGVTCRHLAGPQSTMHRTWNDLILAFCRPVTGGRRALLVSLGFVLLFACYVTEWNAQWDFEVYQRASLALLHGENPYPVESPDSPSPPAKLPYLYSPLFARLVTPIVLLGVVRSKLVWVILKCLALIACAVLTICLVEIPFSVGSFGILVLFMTVYQPIGFDISAGNVALFESGAILAGLYAWKRKRPVLAGFLLTLPAMVKATCLLVLLYPFHRRDWRVLRGVASAIVMLAVLSLPDRRHLMEMLQFLRGPIWVNYWDDLVQGYYNLSAVTVIQHIFGQTYILEPILPIPWVPPFFAPLFPIVVIVLTAWAIAQAEKRRDLSPYDHSILSLVLLTALLLPPRLAGYSLAWTLFPIVSLACRFMACRDKIIGLLLVIGFALIQLHVRPSHVPPGIAQLVIDHCFFGLLFLYAATVRAVSRLRNEMRMSGD